MKRPESEGPVKLIAEALTLHSAALPSGVLPASLIWADLWRALPAWLS